MKLFCLSATIVALSFGMSLHAQTQQGYVKTLGRPNQKGVALSGVSIRAKGAHNAVLSNSQGIFSMSLPGKKNGESYQLQQVQKQGYELSEQGMLGRNYAFSDKVSLTITMVNSRQLQADKQRIENKAYEVAERNYKSRLAALEKQRDANSITIENYREQLQELQNRFDKYQSLIEGLADHYAHVDYDNLDEAERTINLCIENGDLERADSLLQQLGVYNRVEEIHRHLQSGEKLMAEANQDMAAVMKQQDKDAEYLYQLYTIALAKFDNDKARFYIETRAELDTTNVEWQVETGDFVFIYNSDFKRSHYYYERGKRQSLEKYGEKSPFTSRCFMRIASYYHIVGNDELASEYLKKAENALKGLEDEALEEYAENLIIYGQICSTTHAQTSVVNEYRTALAAIIKKYGEHSSEAATYWGHIGGAYLLEAEYDKSLEAYQNCLNIRIRNHASKIDEICRAYNHLGMIYRAKGEYGNAKKYCEEALQGLIRSYGSIHKEIASCYVSISDIYTAQCQYTTALDYAQKALRVMQTLFGDEHVDIPIIYDRLVAIYTRMGQLTNAFEYAEMSLKIRIKVLGDKNPAVASSYRMMGGIAFTAKEYKKAKTLLEKALDIYQNNKYENKANLSSLYNDMGLMYGYMREFKESEKYFKLSVDLKKQLYSGELHQDVAVTYSNMALMYEQKRDINKALDYYNKSLVIDKETIGEYNIKVANVYLSIAELWCQKNNESKVLEAYRKVLSIFRILYGQEHENTKGVEKAISLLTTNPQAFIDAIKRKKVVDK